MRPVKKDFPRNRGQSVYSTDTNYFIEKLNSLLIMLNDSLLPKKVAEAQKILAQFSGLTKQELEMAIRRKNLLIIADKIRHKETEFLNEIDHLLTQNFSEDLMRISNAAEPHDHNRSRKFRNQVRPRESSKRIRTGRTGRSAHPRWNSSSKIKNFFGSRKSLVDQTEEDVLRPSVPLPSPPHSKNISQASDRNPPGQLSVSKDRPISQYQSEKKLPMIDHKKKFNKNATHRLRKDNYSMCYEDYRKAEDEKFGDLEDGQNISAHDDKENDLMLRVPNNTQNFNRRLGRGDGKDKLTRKRNNFGARDDGKYSNSASRGKLYKGGA